jgi:hypothetical protein
MMALRICALSQTVDGTELHCFQLWWLLCVAPVDKALLRWMQLFQLLHLILLAPVVDGCHYSSHWLTPAQLKWVDDEETCSLCCYQDAMSLQLADSLPPVRISLGCEPEYIVHLHLFHDDHQELAGSRSEPSEELRQ